MPSVAEVEDEVARLRDLGLAELRARLRVVTGRPASSRLPRHLLIRMLGYRLQAKAFGDISRESRRILERIADGGDVPPPRRREGPGTVLVREWKGVRHHVMIVKDGFAWNGETYRSLSEVAFAITGTKWSGPRFFGLQQRRAGSQDGTS